MSHESGSPRFVISENETIEADNPSDRTRLYDEDIDPPVNGLPQMSVSQTPPSFDHISSLLSPYSSVSIAVFGFALKISRFSQFDKGTRLST